MKYPIKPTNTLPYTDIVQDPETGERKLVPRELDYAGLVRHAVRNDMRFISTFDGMQAGEKILAALEAYADECYNGFEDHEWKILVEALKHPTTAAAQRGGHGYPISPPYELMPWIRLTIEAPSKKPERQTCEAPAAVLT